MLSHKSSLNTFYFFPQVFYYIERKLRHRAQYLNHRSKLAILELTVEQTIGGEGLSCTNVFHRLFNTSYRKSHLS